MPIGVPLTIYRSASFNLCDNPCSGAAEIVACEVNAARTFWGTTPGQNFIYMHLNRVIKKYDLDMFYIAGPGHGAPALVAIRISKERIVKYTQTLVWMKPV